eukprot:Rmarinus@m.24691
MFGLSWIPIPSIGLGTYKAQDGAVCGAVEGAIATGYQMVDTASMYGNEAAIGQTLCRLFRSDICRREDVFLVSKLWNTDHRSGPAMASVRKTLRDLGVDSVDLLLMHWPVAFVKEGDTLVPRDENGNIMYDHGVSLVDTWRTMEEMVHRGYVKHLGVSNFNERQIDEILSVCVHPPKVLQVECHPYLPQRRLLEYTRRQDIAMVAYAPLGAPYRVAEKDSLLSHPVVVEISRVHKCTPPQVVLAWNIRRGVSCIPKSVTPDRIAENFGALRVATVLTEDDDRKLDSLACGLRLVHPEYSPYARK